jgi:hypothetical protein
MKIDMSNFLIKLNEVQSEERNRTIPIAQLSIMYELYKSETPVRLLNIQYKYNFERYILSRNCMMLSNDKIRDKGKIRQGKGWIVKNSIKGEYDKRLKEVKLTKIGKKIAERIFD